MPRKLSRRAKEPSTYNGIAGALYAIALAVPKWAPYAAAVGAIGNAIAIYLPEGRSE